MQQDERPLARIPTKLGDLEAPAVDLEVEIDAGAQGALSRMVRPGRDSGGAPRAHIVL